MGIISITIMVAAGEGLGAGIQKNQETFGKDVMIVFAGRTSMQAEARVPAVSFVGWKTITFKSPGNLLPANTSCPNSATTLRSAASSIAVRFPSSARSRHSRNS